MAVVVAIVALLFVHFNVPLGAQSVDRSALNGEQLYQAACAACHGNDGRGQPIARRGFDIDLPDFTDCSLTTPEADFDWRSIIHEGGSARSFDRMMPAFGDELTETQIQLVIDHVRSFCAERGWPRGNLNLPRAFVTEKAFPENEVVLTTTLSRGNERSLSNQFLYEHRVGRRGQYELFVPLDLRRSPAGSWQAGVGDMGAAYKHVLYDSLSRGSLLSAGGEVALPTGSPSHGLGNGTAMFEAFGTLSQVLPSDGFLHAHTGFEVPADSAQAAKETFWRLAVGKSFMQHRWGRAWSPMMEVLGARELEEDAVTEWDVLPQVQVSLSNRQHVLMNIGVRTPLSQRRERTTSVLVYVLWDWFDGGLLSGW